MPAAPRLKHRAPAVMIALPQPIPRHFKELGQINPGARHRPDAFGVAGWRTHRLDMLQVNPVLEPPRLVAPSFFAPIVRWGVRQWNWTGMSATPRFQERFVIVGRLTRQVQDRRRMAGAEGRTAGGGYTYLYPQFIRASRAVILGASRDDK